MFPYMLGVAAAIQEDFDLSACKFYSTSGGTAPAACLAANHDITEFFEKCALAGLEECGQRWHGVLGNGLEIASRHLENYIPEDMYQRVNGKISITTTTLFPRPGAAYYTHFYDNEDMCKAMRASSLIPGILTLNACTRYRGTLCMDGGLVVNQPVCPEAPHTVRIYPSKWRPIQPWWVMPCTTTQWNRDLFKFGYEDGKKHAHEMHLEGEGVLRDVGWCQYGIIVMILREFFRALFRFVLHVLVYFRRSK
jgi:hypothetical protein